ncbi:MAG: SMP-30/gluconolactonase/LRE family protein [Acidobacteriota bacterium]
MIRTTLLTLVSLLLLHALPLVADSEPRVRALVRGTSIQGTNGITVGPDDKVYVTSVVGNEIVVVDRRSGRILERMTELCSAEDVIFGPDGALYWTSIYSGIVGRIDPDGTRTTIADLPPGANAITFNDAGRLFVSLFPQSQGLYEVDPTGATPAELLIAEPGMINAFDFGPDGLLYAPDLSTGSVVRIDVDALTIETVATGFSSLLSAVAFDSQGNLYASDPSGELTRVDIATGEREVFATLPVGNDNFAFDRDDNVYTTNLLSGGLIRIKPNGKKRRLIRPGMTNTGGITTRPIGPFRDELWVADTFSLRAFGTFFGRQRDFVPTIPLVTPFVGPNTVTTIGDDLLTSSWIFNAVQVYDPDTDTLLTDLRDFATPLNAIAWDHDIVVAELATGNVVRADGDDPSQREVLATGLAIPTGMALDQGDLYVAEFVTGTLRKITQDGQILDPPSIVATGLAAPEGLVVLHDGDLAVVETGAGRVSRVDPHTGIVTTLVDDLELGAPAPPNVPPTWLFDGITQGRNGRIYVAGNIANVIYSIRLPN